MVRVCDPLTHIEITCLTFPTEYTMKNHLSKAFYPFALSFLMTFPQATGSEFDFNKALEKHSDSTYENFIARFPNRTYLDKLNFDPTQATYYEEVAKKMQLTAAETQLYRKNGFVSIDHGQRYSFGSAYFGIYTRDLPVLITTDSIMHALHKSFNESVIELERYHFIPTLNDALTKIHQQLAKETQKKEYAKLSASFRDLDLYLTVARLLLADGAKQAAKDKQVFADVFTDDGINSDESMQNPFEEKDIKKLELAEERAEKEFKVESLFEQNAKASRVLSIIEGGEINESIQLYGEQRSVDFSQFRPRGHYTKTKDLQNYFKAMMWLGRADCGFNVTPPRVPSSVITDSKRAVQTTAILALLIEKSGTKKEIESIKKDISVLLGEEDGLSLNMVFDCLQDCEVKSIDAIQQPEKMEAIQSWLTTKGLAQQRILSQHITKTSPTSEPADSPGVFNLFGQRFTADSFILSKLVYDNIHFQGRSVERMLPRGLDMAAALGSDLAAHELKQEIQTYPYAANLMACQDYINSYQPKDWNATLYNRWINILKALDDDHSKKPFFPQTMKTKAWGQKQLQTQLASWSQLRHNSALYAKQSYSAGIFCEYPKGYIEPYPEVYRQLGEFAEAMQKCVEQSNLPESRKKRLAEFWGQFSKIQTTLQALSLKQLKGEAFTKEENTFIKKTIDQKGEGCGPPTYDGWYADLFLKRSDSFEWEPEIIDIHTSPDNRGISTCLEVATGDVNFIVAAIDNGKDKTTYVGPAFSYYEFIKSLNGGENRLTDEEWGEMLYKGTTPARPEWIKVFQGPVKKRQLK